MPTDQEIFFGLGFSVSKPGARDRASENVMRTLRSKEVNNTNQFYPFILENIIGCEGSLKQENELKHHENFVLMITDWPED